MRAWVAGALFCAVLPAQVGAPAAEAPADPLGRGTPRGTVLGFLAACRKGDMAAAAQFLNTRLRGDAAARSASQLCTVLDRRLPPRLQDLSDKPEGSLTDLKSNQDIVGTISAEGGDVPILVERVAQGKNGTLWLFSRETLDRIPELFDEINTVPIDKVLPPYLVNERLAGVPLYQWLLIFCGLPAAYLLIALFNRLVSKAARRTDLIPLPVRLLLLALVIRRLLAEVSLPLLTRQFWATVSSVLAIAGAVWLFIVWNGCLEHLLRRRLARRGRLSATPVLRLARRALDILVLSIGVLVALYHFGFNPTAVLAGLGVGGVAVALAAQKTLENVVGGISIVFDEAVRVGEVLKVGDTLGTVIEVGLRSTRIRTLDRTILTVPNGQIATLTLENLSARDKFWFHPILKLRPDVTARQMRTLIEKVSAVVQRHPAVEQNSHQVRFLRFGNASVDLEVFAYLKAGSFDEFLAAQSELLVQLTEQVEAVEAHLASQPALLAA
jgi:MscS family membrane protein